MSDRGQCCLTCLLLNAIIDLMFGRQVVEKAKKERNQYIYKLYVDRGQKVKLFNM